MNEEMSTRLAQELLSAPDEDARARVVVRWLPNFARCQVATSARVKAIGAKIDALAAKVDAYHAVQPRAGEGSGPKPPEDPRTTRLKLILAFAQRNWAAFALLAILVKVFGLTDLLAAILGFFAGH